MDQPRSHSLDQPVRAVGGISQNPWVTLILLTLANIFMTLDRTIPQLLTEPIREEFGLTDSQLGIVLGLAFSIPLGIAGIVLGPVIDRVRRVRFLALILSIWSSLTFVTGFAATYVQLVAARAGLGAAEAGASPTAMSLLGDMFPVKRRATAIGIYKVGVPLGILLASGLVGFVANAFGWRYAFFAAGLPGIMISLLILLLLQEPVRGAQDRERFGEALPTSYSATLTFIFRDRTIFAFAIAMFLINFAGAAISGFGTSFLQRYHGLDLRDVGFVWAIGSTFGILSPIAAGWLADRVALNGFRPTFALIAGMSAALGATAVGMALMPNAPLAVMTFLLWQFLVLGVMTPCMGAMVSLTPPHMRGTVLSITLVGNMCFGFGLGPTVLGLTSDMIGGSQSLRNAVILIETLSTLAIVASLLYAREAVRDRDSRSGARKDGEEADSGLGSRD